MDESLQVASGLMGHLALPDPSSLREGSLPFKKRKLYRSGSSSMSLSSQESPVSPFGRPVVSFGGNDEKIAALALVAAASALPVSTTNSTFPSLFLSPSVIEKHNKRTNTIQDEPKNVSSVTQAKPAPQSSQEPQTQPQSSRALQTSQVPPEASPGSKQKTKSRVHHPPLRSPLPGGCHGRTARNNSYCRRQPCYNGSKYCKLHYQMHVVSGMRPIDSDTVGEKTRKHSPVAIPTAQTDKRFQGLDGEVQCSATTTRGRPCSYVCVNDTKYCFLHAEYESNPPPKRGAGCTSMKKRAASVSSGTAESSASAEDFSVASEIVIKTPSKPARTSSEEPCLPSALVTPHLTSSNSVSEASASTPKKNITTRDGKPVLSSLSYDQWLNKKVMIATGPLSNHVGHVEKWGNGWVTVRLAQDTSKQQDEEGLLHNRRAVELFLVPDDPEESFMVSTEKHVIQAAETGTPLLRCVSREIDAQGSDAVSLHSRQEAVSPIELIGSQIEHSDTVTAFDTTVQGKERDKLTSEPIDDNESQLKASCEAPAIDKDTLPSYAKSVVSDISNKCSPPLSESVMLAQSKGLRNKALGLLFGTAALERGRRKIQSPTRYEDTAMIEKGKSRQSTPVSSPRTPKKAP